MFFNNELFQKRDSGFGLLWLAATLGAKSSLKKLPKRSIMTADISHLCGMISEPEEPLALRLSSNLMVGAARVYKIKHEIFISDVTTCFTTLKKAMLDLHLNAVSEAQLQMVQNRARTPAVTLGIDPTLALALEFGNALGSWEDLTSFRSQRLGASGSDDDDFTPGARKRIKPKKPSTIIPPVEIARAGVLPSFGGIAPHTLAEHHDLFFSPTFPASGEHSLLSGAGPSSSAFDFDNDGFFGADVGDLRLDLGLDLGLGEEWGAPADFGGDALSIGMDVDQPFTFDVPDEGLNAMDIDNLGPPSDDFIVGADGVRRRNKRTHAEANKENTLMSGSPRSALRQPSIGRSNLGDGVEFDGEPILNTGDPFASAVEGDGVKAPRKAKRVRLLLDARTELTDEELKAAREKYVEGQDAIRAEIMRKRLEKKNEKAMQEMIWGVPQGLDGPILKDFWISMFRVQVEARSGAVHLQERGEAPNKKRRIHLEGAANKNKDALNGENDDQANLGGWNDMGDNMFGGGDDMNFGPLHDDTSRLRSSEEPERARRGTRPPSLVDAYNSFFNGQGVSSSDFLPPSGSIPVGGSQSQRSLLFPWDNAGGLSSSNRGGRNSDLLGLEKADVKLYRRGSQGSKEGGSRRSSALFSLSDLVPGHVMSGRGSVGEDDFQFDVPHGDTNIDVAIDMQNQSDDLTLVTLERNSYNFLEYCKLQLKTLPGVAHSLGFDAIVPTTTSTPHVAASAFYHCLVLATKNLIRVQQDGPFNMPRITVL